MPLLIGTTVDEFRTPSSAADELSEESLHTAVAAVGLEPADVADPVVGHFGRTPAGRAEAAGVTTTTEPSFDRADTIEEA
ncbi:hypothetical protein [Streptomyces sp. NPDC056061]|uniref:hypothetical protein n=1 Tax=Streptomyces sp. NPDC056061 TaxID=3345700 RepID=UPI0035E2CEF4